MSKPTDWSTFVPRNQPHEWRQRYFRDGCRWHAAMRVFLKDRPAELQWLKQDAEYRKDLAVELGLEAA